MAGAAGRFLKSVVSLISKYIGVAESYYCNCCEVTVCLLDDRRRHEDDILGAMHTFRGFLCGWFNIVTYLGVAMFPKKVPY